MENLDLLKEVMDGMPGGYFVYRAGGDEELIHVNQSVLRIFGCDTMEEFKELTGFTFKGMVHPDDLEMAEESISEQIQESVYDLDYLEYRIIRKDGTVRWVQDYGHFVHSEKYGDIFYVFIDDATERMKMRMTELEVMNRNLKRSVSKEKQYRNAILQDAVSFYEVNFSKDRFTSPVTWVVDGEQVDLFEYLDMEPFTRYSEFIEFWAKHRNLSNEEYFQNFFQLDRLVRCYEKGECEQVFEAWAVNSKGQKRLCRYTLLLGCDEASGDVIGLAITRDLTDVAEGQKLIELALSQAKAANIARTTFLHNISHDVRTPLNGIVGYVDLIRGSLNDKEKVNGYLEKIRMSSFQLLDTINSSLEYTRSESGRAILLETEGNILDLLAELEKQILPRSNAKGLVFLVDKSKIRHYKVAADFVRMKDVLYQLLDNAVKYTEKNGEIRFSVIEKENAPKGYVKYQFIVADTGAGMEQEFVNKVFEPFEREHDAGDSGVVGSGLGLAVVKSMLDMMEGSVEVESTPGVGSKFTVTVLFRLAAHMEEEHLKEQERLQEHNVELKGKKILVVEDDELNMEIITGLLEMMGVETEGAENGQVAFDKVKESAPGGYDMILMDIQMPVMDGCDATKKIREMEDKERAEIPIVALSANAFAEDVKKALDVGMNAHISKPADMAVLESKIKEVLDNG